MVTCGLNKHQKSIQIYLFQQSKSYMTNDYIEELFIQILQRLKFSYRLSNSVALTSRVIKTLCQSKDFAPTEPLSK